MDKKMSIWEKALLNSKMSKRKNILYEIEADGANVSEILMNCNSLREAAIKIGVGITTLERYINKRRIEELENELRAANQKLTIPDWIPIENGLPEYTARIGGNDFVNVILADSAGGVWAGDYTNGKFMVFGVEHPGITDWMPFPDPPENQKLATKIRP